MVELSHTQSHSDSAHGATKLRPPRDWVLRAAWASLAVNVLIVVTGGVVRLTGSGLGCPTWPQCTEESFTPHGAMSINAAIEFGNRMVTFAIGAVAIATFIIMYRSGRPGLTRLAAILAIGVPAQAVLGGVTVLTDLNPWIVAGHLLVSMAMICVATLLVLRARGDVGPNEILRAPADAVVWLARATWVVGWAVLYLGTVVTGSGPHAGDVNAPRNGLDPRAMSQLHADAVFLLVGLSVALVAIVHATQAARSAQLATRSLLAVILVQGAIGFLQYFTGLPAALVAAHLVGAAATAAALTWMVLSVRPVSQSTN